MATEGARPRRVGESIRRELAPLLDDIARDKRLGLVSITSVDVSPDLRQATVHVTSLGDVDQRDLFDVLTEARPRLRHHLARVLKLRLVPELRFRADDSLERQARVSALLRGDIPDED